MGRFNFDEWKNKKVVMHCKTLEEAMSFCDEMHKSGFKWLSGQSYKDETNFYNYKSETCYKFNDGVCGHINAYKKERFIILEWGDYMNSETMREHYKEQILDVVCSHGSFAINRKNGEIVSCVQIDCWDCLFRNNCIVNRAKWANSPYIPPFDEKKWITEWYRKYKKDTKVNIVFFDGVTIVVDRNGKMGLAKRRKTETDNYKKGIAIAYARYCGEDIPKEL